MEEGIKKSKLFKWLENYTGTDITYVSKGLFWILIGKIFVFLFSFLTMLAFSIFVSKETFGSYQYILSIFAIASVASLPGANISLIRSISIGKYGTFKYLLKKRINWSLLGSFLMFCISFWYFYQKNFLLGVTIFLLAFGLPLITPYELFEFFWNGKKDFKKSTLYSSLSLIIPSILTITTILFSQNLILIIFIFIISNFLTRWFITRKILKNEIENYEIDDKALPIGKSLTLIQGIDIISSYIDKIFIWKFLGPVSVAIYSFAQTPISKMLQLTPIQVLSLPKLSEQNIYQNKKVIIKKFLKLFLLMIPIALLFIIFIPFLYKVFFHQYLEAIPYVKILGLLIALLPFSFLTTAMIAAAKRKEITWIQITTFLIKIVLFFIYVPIYGIWGIVYPTIGIEILKGILTFYFFLKIKE